MRAGFITRPARWRARRPGREMGGYLRAHRLRVTMDPERPDHADLLAAVETAPAGGGRRAWLRDLVMAGFRRVGTYEQWRARLAGRDRSPPTPMACSAERGPSAAPTPARPGREEPGGSAAPGRAVPQGSLERNGTSAPAPRPEDNGSLERSPTGDGDESCAILKLL